MKPDHRAEIAWWLAVAIAAVLVLILMSGCASTLEKPPDLVSRVDTVTVKVPVPIPCVDANEKPEIPATNLRPAQQGLSGHQQLARYIEQLRADINDWRSYGIRADAILNSCIAKGKP